MIHLLCILRQRAGEDPVAAELVKKIVKHAETNPMEVSCREHRVTRRDLHKMACWVSSLGPDHGPTGAGRFLQGRGARWEVALRIRRKPRPGPPLHHTELRGILSSGY